MTGLVVSRQLLFLIADLMGFLLRTDHNFDSRILDLLHRQRFLVLTCCQQRRLVQQVFKIRARKACRRLRDDFQINVRTERFSLGMDLQDLLSALDVGIADRDLPVKTTGTQQSGIENIGTVGRGNNDNAFVRAHR